MMIRFFCLLLLSGVMSRTTNEEALTSGELDDLRPLPTVSDANEDESVRVGAARHGSFGHRCFHLEYCEGQCVCCGHLAGSICISPPGSIDKCTLYVKNLLLAGKPPRKSYTLPPNFPLPTDPTDSVV